MSVRANNTLGPVHEILHLKKDNLGHKLKDIGYLLAEVAIESKLSNLS